MAQSPLRVYPHYGRALAGVCEEQGLHLIALGSRHERELNQQNIEESGARGINLCGELTLRQTATILKRCRLAVGAETGTAHIACAVGTPNVILVGGGHFGRFMPYSRLTTVVCLPLRCYGCNWRCSHERAHCVKDVHPEVISQAVREALAKESEQIRVFSQASSMWLPLPGEPKWKGCGQLLSHYRFEMRYVHDPESEPAAQTFAAPFMEKGSSDSVETSPAPAG